MRGLSTIASAYTSLADGYIPIFLTRQVFLAAFLFLISSMAPLVSQSAIPQYTHEHAEPMGSAGISTLGNIVISLDTDSQGNVYVLTFGGKIYKFNASGEPEGSFNLKADIESPVDIAINSIDEIFVADHEKRIVYAFDLNGNRLSSKDQKSDYYKPLGITFDSFDNLYVLDYNDGTGAESDISSRLKIYFNDGSESGELLKKELIQPYRIGVNSEGRIYISQAGVDGRGEVVIFSSTYQSMGKMPNLGSPGSVVVDSYDYVHVIDYADKLNFSKILERDPGYLLGAIDDIKDGIENNEFSIKIFDRNNSLVKTFKDNLDLPLDLAFGYCAGKMYVNDSKVEGSFFSTKLVFTLEVYNRNPGFDNEAPVATCIASGKEFLLENGSVTISAEEINNASTDNCGIASTTVSPDRFTEAGDHVVTLTVTDTSGNIDTCTTSVTILGPDAALEITCPGPQEGQLDENCQFVIPDYTELGELSDSNAIVSQSPAPGTNIDADTKIVLTASLNDESVSCEFQLNLVDNTPPVMECFTSITGVYDSSKGFELQDYGRNISIQDNCGSAPVITQDPPEGTLIYVDESTITFTATDASGNTSTCTVDLVLTDVPESLRFTACPDTQVEELDANCQFVIPDYTQAAETNYPDAEITQDPPAGQLVQGKAAIQVYLTATRGDEMVKCRVPLQVVDLLPPDMLCPGDQADSYDPAEGFLIPDYSSLAQGEDNCGELIVSQNPPEGTVVFGDTPIQLNFRDPSGNWFFCNFRLLLEEIEGPIFECPNTEELLFLELNEECKVEAPDYRDHLSSFTGFKNEPHFVQTEVQNGNILAVHIEVFDGEGGTFVGECDFDVSLLDTTLPQINCPASTINLSPEEDGNYILPDFRNRASDTCDSNLEIVQDPPPGVITSGGTVTLSAVDDSGNVSETCEFEVVLLQEGEPSFDCHEFDAVPQIVVNEDCSIGDPDFSDLVSNFQNFQDSPLIVQSLQISGKTLLVHIEVYDGEQELEFLVGECDFEIQLVENIAPEALCIQEITVKLGEEGTVMITPEDIDNGSSDGCGIVSYKLSRDTFTVDDLGNDPIEVELTVTDDYGNTDSCTVLVTVEPYVPTEPGAVICETSITLPLNANGEAQLDLEQLYEGDLGPGGTVSVDNQFFTCDDLGIQTVTLQYSGTSTGSCNIEVNVVDEIAPTPMVKDIDISLDENGAASITAEDINNGSTDNCGASTLQYSLGQSSFNCSDIGSNFIRFTVTDASGNSASAEANVFVSDPLDHCVVDPVVPPEDRFVILFPNPSRGQVQIATSADIVLDRVEIFDTRGRFLDARELKRNPATRSYHLDLEKYQTGVYTLKIYTEEREYVRRAIITTF